MGKNNAFLLALLGICADNGLMRPITKVEQAMVVIANLATLIVL